MNKIAVQGPITVVFATDNAYCQHLAVTILSLIEHNSTEAFDLIVLSREVTDFHKNHLFKIIQEKTRVSLKFIELGSSCDGSFFIDGHVSVATYARIFIPQMIGPEINKVLYLDCDLYVADSIRPLWETNIMDYALAGVEELVNPRRKSLGIPENKPYVNAGVLLINLDAWRTQDLTNALVHFIENNTGLLTYHDQDALNAVLFNQILYLNPRWNVSYSYSHNLFYVKAEQIRSKTEKQQCLTEEPGIVHFTTDYKPWHYLNPNPYRHHYWRLLKTTPYQNYRPPLRSAFKFLPVKLRPQSMLATLFPKKRRSSENVRHRKAHDEPASD